MDNSTDKNTIDSRTTILSYPVDLLPFNRAVEKCKRFIGESKSAHVVTLNPEMIKQAQNNKELDEAVRNAEIILPDGVGIVLALKLRGIKQERVPGIEYAQSLLDFASQSTMPVGFLGAKEETLNKAVSNLKIQYNDLNIVYQRNGFFEEDQEKKIFEEIKSCAPAILFVALGVPRQELLISKYKKYLTHTIMVGVGGSFDVWSNEIQRAPFIFRKLGLEWFYRLVTQPSRFKRMFPTLPLFLIKVILNKSN